MELLPHPPRRWWSLWPTHGASALPTLKVVEPLAYAWSLCPTHLEGDGASDLPVQPLSYPWSFCPTHLEGDGASGRLGTGSQHVVLGAPLLTGDEDDGALLVPGLDETQEVRHARVDAEKHHHLQKTETLLRELPNEK